ncbi:peptide MFS transporter [Membranihabitans maritimus]|uniref:peptide MFS transporter n=1 Tax=Membranihabitans maritimus TaxID=2904244 RepID=UPI001F45A669|nr:peptide MFS transporter [Membranihabitans maritimus]
MAETNTTNRKRTELLGHPVGLFILFFTELWERFSYYGMRALLVLYMTAISTGDNPGFGWSNEDALQLYGWYTMLVYISSIPGGWIADKILGQKKTVMLGGALLCAGHGVLAIDSISAFYAGLGLIIAGVGCLKPNISTMVGGLYGAKDERRDVGFTIFYIGINIGALLAPLLCGYLGEKYGWHLGFGLAAIGMFFGQIVYIWGQKYLKGVGDFIGNDDNPHKEFQDKPLTSQEKDRVKVLFISFLLVILFWGAFEQAGGLLNLWADQKTDRMFLGWEIPASWFQSVNSFFIITLGSLIAGFWYRRKMKGKEASSLFKMPVGLIIQGVGFFFMAYSALEFAGNGSTSFVWLILFYLFSTIGELCLSPVALSFITKLAPVKYASLMMGAFWAATGLGNKLAGLLGEYSQSAGEFEIFTGIAIFSIAIGGLVLLILKPLKRLTHGAEDLAVQPAH